MTTTAPTWEIDLPYPAPPLSLNKRMHYQAEHRVRTQILSDVAVLARALKIPKGLQRVEIALHWQARVIRRRDSDNPTPTLKVCIDALTKYGLTEDDDSAHVESACVIEPLGPKSRLWLTITEVTA
jgi:Holliday junction resolvase RusA-like endonuclease